MLNIFKEYVQYVFILGEKKDEIHDKVRRMQ